MIDSHLFHVPAVSGLVYAYQRDLASILSLATITSENCNPFCANKMSNKAACYTPEWGCKDACEAAATFHTPFFTSMSLADSMDSE